MDGRMMRAILAAYAEQEKHLGPDLPGDTPVPLLVRFRLDNLRSLKHTAEEIALMTPHANKA
jgi:hypothetical protein